MKHTGHKITEYTVDLFSTIHDPTNCDTCARQIQESEDVTQHVTLHESTISRSISDSFIERTEP